VFDPLSAKKVETMLRCAPCRPALRAFGMPLEMLCLIVGQPLGRVRRGTLARTLSKTLDTRGVGTSVGWEWNRGSSSRITEKERIGLKYLRMRRISEELELVPSLGAPVRAP
jgi:hypothetical protein